MKRGIISKHCSNTSNTRLPFLGSLSSRSDHTKYSPSSREGAAAAAGGDTLCRHKHRSSLPSQAGDMRGCHLPRMVPSAKTPRQVRPRHHHCRDVPHQLSHGRWDGGCCWSGCLGLGLEIKFCLWSPLGPSLEISAPVRSLCKSCFPDARGMNYSGSFCLHLSCARVKGNQKLKLHIFTSSNKALKHLINFKHTDSLTKSEYLHA